MPKATEVLKQDHDQLRQLLPQLMEDALSAERRHEILNEIERAVKVHSLIEEEIFYPAFKDAASSQDDRDMYREAIEEHHAVDMLLPEMKLLKADTDGFRGKAKVLREQLEHHAEDEETEMFPRADELLGNSRLMELGERLVERKLELEKQWDSTIGGAMRKTQSVLDKFMPTKVKDMRVERHREHDGDDADRRDEQR